MTRKGHASRLAAWAIPVLIGLLIIPAPAHAQSNVPAISAISPTRGPEGTRVQIVGSGLQGVSAVLFGSTPSTFKIVSAEKIVAIVPHRSSTSKIAVVGPRGRIESPALFLVDNDPRIPEEVSYKAGYINPVPPPIDFHSPLLWGIAIADVRVAGYEAAEVRIASTKLTCRIDGKDIVLNDDAGKVRGGLYRRQPWFGTDQHEDMPMTYNEEDHATVLRVGSRTDRVWHFWSASSRASLPAGKLEGCRVTARVKIFAGGIVANGHGLLAFGDCSFRLRWK